MKTSRQPLFRPYQHMKNVLYKDYLKKAMLWLFGMEDENDDCEQTQILAIGTKSPWQIAWLVIFCLEAKKIDQLQKDEKFAGIVDAKIAEGVEWLLEHPSYKDDTYIHWDNSLYDTSLVLRALMMYFEGENLEAEAKEIIEKALNWIFWKMKADDKGNVSNYELEKHGTSTITAVIRIYPYLKNISIAENKKVRFKETTQILLEYVIDREKNNETSDKINQNYDTSKNVISVSQMLCLLLEKKITELKCTKQDIKKTQDMIFSRMMSLEKLLKVKYAHHGQTAHNLATYIRNYNVLKSINYYSHYCIDNDIIMANLHFLCDREDYMKDGSLFHDIFATTYFARALIALLLYWKQKEMYVFELYETNTKNYFQRANLETSDRVRELSREVTEQKRLRATHNWRLRIFMIVMILIYIIAFIFFEIRVGDSLPSVIVLIGISLTIIATLSTAAYFWIFRYGQPSETKK